MRISVKASGTLSAVYALMALSFAQALEEKDTNDLFSMDFDELIEIQVSTSAKFEQSSLKTSSVISVITSEEIHALGANSLMEVLERSPSMMMMGSYFFPQNVAAIRGDILSHAGNHTLMLVNGRPMRESFTGGENFAIFTSFPLDTIKQIEIIRGPGSVLYGSNGITGVINIITWGDEVKAPKQVKVSVGSFGTRSVELAHRLPLSDGYLRIGSRYFTEDGWRFEAVDNDGIKGGFDTSEKNASLVVNGKINGVKINAHYLKGKQNFWGSTSRWGGEPPVDQRYVTSERSMIDFGYEFQHHAGAYTDVNISYTRNRFSHYNYDSYSNNTFMESTYHNILDNLSRLTLGATIWHQQAGSVGGMRVAPVPDFSQNWYSLYGQYSNEFDNGWNVTVGAQLNKVPDVDANIVPRISGMYNFDSNSGIKFMYGESFRAAYAVETRFDLVICCSTDGTNRGGLRGNPSLEPESASTAEVQYFKAYENYMIAATVFYTEQSELIERLRAADNVLDFINRGKLDSKGAEFEFRRFVNDDLQFFGSFSYQTNENDAGLDDVTLMPNKMLKVGMIYSPHNHWSLGLFNNWNDGFHDNAKINPNRAAVNPIADSYNLLTLNFRYDLETVFPNLSHSELSLYGYNLLDEDIHQPEIASRTVNTNPFRAERSFYLNFTFSFD